MGTQAPAGVDAAGLQIFQEVLQSLMLQHPLEETLGLTSRRVCELGEFDFCGIVLPDDQWEHMHLAASHAFPPDYVKRLNELWLGALRADPPAGAPTLAADLRPGGLADRVRDPPPRDGGAHRRAVRRVVPPVARARDGVRLPLARVRSAR